MQGRCVYIFEMVLRGSLSGGSRDFLLQMLWGMSPVAQAITLAKNDQFLVYYTLLNVQARYQQAAMLRSKVHRTLCPLAKEDQLFGPNVFLD